MGKTLFEKIWDKHVVKELPGGEVLLYIDRHLVHEVTSPQAFEGLKLHGRKVRHPELTFATTDHNVPTDSRSEITDEIAARIKAKDFKGEKNEGKRRIDQRGDRRADIAKASAACQQIDIDPIARGVIADGQCGQEQQGPNDHNGQDGDIETIGERKGCADRLKRQKRNRSNSCVCDTRIAPPACAAGCKAQSKVFHRFIRDPAIVSPFVAGRLKPRRHEFFTQLSTRHHHAFRAQPECPRRIFFPHCSIRDKTRRPIRHSTYIG